MTETMQLLSITGKLGNKYKQTIAYALVDDDIYDVLRARTWSIHSQGYPISSYGGKYIFLHLEVFRLRYGDKDTNTEIHHKDGNKLNAQTENLEELSNAKHSHHHPQRQHNTSGFTGVHYHKHAKKYVARVTVEKKVHSLGYYNNKEEAAKAVNDAYRNLLPGFLIPNPTVEGL